MTEADLQRTIQKALGVLGVHVIRSRMDRRTSNQVGTPDLLFAYLGVPYAWEVKRPGGKTSSAQDDTLRALSRNGWRVAVVTDLQAAMALLQPK